MAAPALAPERHRLAPDEPEHARSPAAPGAKIEAPRAAVAKPPVRDPDLAPRRALAFAEAYDDRSHARRQDAGEALSCETEGDAGPDRRLAD